MELELKESWKFYGRRAHDNEWFSIPTIPMERVRWHCWIYICTMLQYVSTYRNQLRINRILSPSYQPLSSLLTSFPFLPLLQVNCYQLACKQIFNLYKYTPRGSSKPGTIIYQRDRATKPEAWVPSYPEPTEGMCMCAVRPLLPMNPSHLQFPYLPTVLRKLCFAS